MTAEQKAKATKVTKKALIIAGKVLNVLLIVVLLFFLVYNVYCMVATKKGEDFPMLFGFGTAIVGSGSMSPTLEVNDLIVVIRSESYGEGDIVTFKDEWGTAVTHRIVGVNPDGTFITKGDYKNNTVDEFALPKESIYGKVVWVVKGYGKVKTFFSKPLGAIILLAIVLLIVFAPNIGSAIKKVVKSYPKSDKTSDPN